MIPHLKDCSNSITKNVEHKNNTCQIDSKTSLQKQNDGEEIKHEIKKIKK